eukprot:TRINITY_DN8773_c0_g1_i1.p1 TRINITY_DN8773_c0_g1~~TRINITY_DN8773_c0_g1_i1.p1  ORF type:complete len:216 (-),score=35.00 TRINITY_DN8773_c0_g1_i1:4-651(-)
MAIITLINNTTWPLIMMCASFLVTDWSTVCHSRSCAEGPSCLTSGEKFTFTKIPLAFNFSFTFVGPFNTRKPIHISMNGPAFDYSFDIDLFMQSAPFHNLFSRMSVLSSATEDVLSPIFFFLNTMPTSIFPSLPLSSPVDLSVIAYVRDTQDKFSQLVISPSNFSSTEIRGQYDICNTIQGPNPPKTFVFKGDWRTLRQQLMSPTAILTISRTLR